MLSINVRHLARFAGDMYNCSDYAIHDGERMPFTLVSGRIGFFIS